MSVRMSSAKRTVSRTWFTQYSGSHTDSVPATSWMVGVVKASPDTTARKSSSIGSISGEWNACETRRRVVLRPRSSKWVRTDSTWSAAPDTTTEVGPLTAATDTNSPSSGRTSASVACTASIAPPSDNACINWPRAATSVHASARDSTPATWAAATSPIE
ncbi:hypothetical protein GCM10010334_71870 [Streptomyces finlayi]|uniref:Uncharacterized protein n=1 Tax=Streptomyces finlayi TaxID=67296 RepID=A0A918X686_9ACTN|nr:hypothetical protein GCM10010334_71870 [Streptomyces finlayi]